MQTTMRRAKSGRVIEGLELLEHAVGETAVRSQSYYPQALLHLGEGYLEAGRGSDGEDCGQRALDLARTRGERGREAHALRLLADVAARGGSPADESAQDRYGLARHSRWRGKSDAEDADYAHPEAQAEPNRGRFHSSAKSYSSCDTILSECLHMAI